MHSQPPARAQNPSAFASARKAIPRCVGAGRILETRPPRRIALPPRGGDEGDGPWRFGYAGMPPGRHPSEQRGHEGLPPGRQPPLNEGSDLTCSWEPGLAPGPCPALPCRHDVFHDRHAEHGPHGGPHLGKAPLGGRALCQLSEAHPHHESSRIVSAPGQLPDCLAEVPHTWFFTRGRVFGSLLLLGGHLPGEHSPPPSR